MKKVVLVLSILILILLIGSVSALVKTRIYGKTKPNVNVRLSITYTANGQEFQNQPIKKVTDNSGNWEYKIASDEGTIEIEATSLGITKTFAIEAGPDFEIKFSDEDKEETNETTASITGSLVDEDEEETTEDEEQVEETETADISSEAVSGEKWDIKSKLGNWSLYLLILGLFVLIIAANLVSEVLIGAFRRVGKNKSEKPIKIVKLSEKLEKAKQKLARAQQQEQAVEQQLKEVKGGL